MGGLEAAHLQLSSNSNLHYGSSPLNSNAGVSTSSSSSSQLTGSQDAFPSGIDDYFGGGGADGVTASSSATTTNLVGETEFQSAEVSDWAYDPNEPRYRICNQVS